MNHKEASVVQSALDSLALSLTDHKHHFSNEEKRLYNEASRICKKYTWKTVG